MKGIPKILLPLHGGGSIIQEICSGHNYSKNNVRGQGRSDPKMVRDTPSSQTNSYTKLGIPISMNIRDMHQTQCGFKKLDQRSRSWWPKYGTWHSVTPRYILAPNLGCLLIIIWDMLRTIFSLKTKSEVKVKLGQRSRSVTQKWYATIHYRKMHPHTKFGMPTLNYIRDIHQTQCGLKNLGQRSRSQWPNYGTRHSVIPRYTNTPNLWFLPQII